MKTATHTTRTIIILSVALVALIAVLSCIQRLPAGRQQYQEYTRTTMYSSLDSLSKDSDLIVEGTVGEQKTAHDLSDTVPFTIATVTVNGIYKGEDTDAKQIEVRQTGTADEAPLHNGTTYILFLTRSGLQGDKAGQYYITGVTAGVYRKGAAMARSGMESSYRRVDSGTGDNLPERIRLSDITSADK